MTDIFLFSYVHAISTLQMLLVDPTSARMDEPVPRFAHLVLLSSTFEAGFTD
jgi:hypothetical protein